MNISTRTGFLALALGAAISYSPIWAAPTNETAKADATKTPLKVTRDNFVSFSWQQTGGFAGISTTIAVEGNTLSQSRPRRGPATGENANAPQTRGLSNKQLDELIDKLAESKFPEIVGNYRQEGLFDGFNEVAILTLSDENNEDRRFVIQNYGDKAPKSYLDFVAYFRTMADKKLSVPDRSFPIGNLTPNP